MEVKFAGVSMKRPEVRANIDELQIGEELTACQGRPAPSALDIPR